MTDTKGNTDMPQSPSAHSTPDSSPTAWRRAQWTVALELPLLAAIVAGGLMLGVLVTVTGNGTPDGDSTGGAAATTIDEQLLVRPGTGSSAADPAGTSATVPDTASSTTVAATTAAELPPCDPPGEPNHLVALVREDRVRLCGQLSSPAQKVAAEGVLSEMFNGGVDAEGLTVTEGEAASQPTIEIRGTVTSPLLDSLRFADTWAGLQPGPVNTEGLIPRSLTTVEQKITNVLNLSVAEQRPLFRPSRSEVEPTAMQTVGDIAALLAEACGSGSEVLVSGHGNRTGDPVSDAGNLATSTNRAINLVEKLYEVKPQLRDQVTLRPAGYGAARLLQGAEPSDLRNIRADFRVLSGCDLVAG